MQVVLTRRKGRPCHRGAVEVLLHDAISNKVMTSGADGVVKLWDFHTINDAEADEDTTTKAILSVEEMLIAPGQNMIQIIRGAFCFKTP